MSDFNFNYQAPTNEERKEIENIRKNYIKKESTPPSKLNQLRNLDKKVKNIPAMLALICGILGTLIFGTGLALILEWDLVFWGVIISVLGVIPAILAYIVYQKSYEHLKNKYSAEILKLSDELLNEQDN